LFTNQNSTKSERSELRTICVHSLAKGNWKSRNRQPIETRFLNVRYFNRIENARFWPPITRIPQINWRNWRHAFRRDEARSGNPQELV
jgi:hypothetical protein